MEKANAVGETVGIGEEVFVGVVEEYFVRCVRPIVG